MEGFWPFDPPPYVLVFTHVSGFSEGSREGQCLRPTACLIEGLLWKFETHLQCSNRLISALPQGLSPWADMNDAVGVAASHAILQIPTHCAGAKNLVLPSV